MDVSIIFTRRGYFSSDFDVVCFIP